MRRAAPAGGRRRTLAAAPFTDDFATTLNTSTKWTGTSYSYSIVTGRLRLPCTTGAPQIQSGTVFDLAAQPIYVQMPTVPVAGNGGTQTFFRISNGSNNLEFYLQGAPLSFALRGTGIGSTFVTYSATPHAWLRYSISGGNVLWETSPDKTTWTAQKTAAVPSWLTGALVNVTLACGYFGTEAAPGNAEFDNFNL